MTYRQNDTPRTCSICTEAIGKDDWMIDLFRGVDGKKVEWVHEACARKAMEVWLERKRAAKTA